METTTVWVMMKGQDPLMPATSSATRSPSVAWS
jgi:hypothetical protein